MKVVAIIQARMGSTRLPGKILKEINEKPLLSYQLERLSNSIFINEFVIATTKKNKMIKLSLFVRNKISCIIEVLKQMY